MTSLFFFGTLRHRPLLEIVLGTLSHVTITEAELPGYQALSASEGPFPGLLPQSGRSAEGVLVEGLTEQDLLRLDHYEGGFGYQRTPVTLACGRKADVFLADPASWTPEGGWSFSSWQQDWSELSCRAAREVMGYLGSKTPQEIATMFPRIRARAWGAMNAEKSRHGAGTLRGKVNIIDRQRPYADFYALDDFTLSHERFDGTMSEPIRRAVFQSGDASVVLPYDPVRDRVLLVEQIRMGPLARGDQNLWQLEPVAGMVDAGEPPEASARREAFEEAGLTIETLHPVAETYGSPGASTGFYYIYVGIADLPDDCIGLGGLDDEHEDIRSHLMSFDILIALCDAQEVTNSPLITSAYWLARHRVRLRNS